MRVHFFSPICCSMVAIFVGCTEFRAFELQYRIMDGPYFNVGSDDEAEPDKPPASFQGASAYPNPFFGKTVVTFSLDREQTVQLSVFDATGKCLLVLANQRYRKGQHELSWAGRDGYGR